MANGFFNYLGVVMRRACVSWKDDAAWISVSGYVAIIALPFLFSGLLAELVDEAVARFFPWVAIVWLVALVTIVTPYRLWRDSQSQIQSLEDRIKPILVFTDPFEETEERDVNYIERALWIGLKNESEGKTVIGAIPFVEIFGGDGQKITAQRVSLECRYHSGGRVGLDPQDDMHCLLAKLIIQSGHSPIFRIGTTVHTINGLNEGERLRLKLYGRARDMSPTIREIVIWHEDKHLKWQEANT